LLRII
jgi:hypothetical protein